MKYGVVVIGRNEGERLRQCLMSLPRASVTVYVDSGSSDGSVQRARHLGADVIELDMRVPFTAARARNAGFRRLREISPDLEYVQFLDGDCELIDGWLEDAISFLNAHADVGGSVRSATRALPRAFDLQLAMRPGMGWAGRRRALLWR